MKNAGEWVENSELIAAIDELIRRYEAHEIAFWLQKRYALINRDGSRIECSYQSAEAVKGWF
jgi:hypothetical protein